MKLKNLLYAAITLGTIVHTSLAYAQWAGYQGDDVILVLWANSYDSISYDLGNVNQFQNHTNGYQVQVDNWETSAATTYFGPFPANGGYVSLNFNIGAASTADYVPYVTETYNPNYLTSGTRRNLANDLNNYGEDIFNGINDPSGPEITPTNYAVIPPTSSDAYDYGANTEKEQTWNDTTVLSGSVFTGIPGAIIFWEVGAGTSTNLGTFQFTADGRLFFEVPPILNKTSITNFVYDGVSEADATFPTIIGANYRLLESTNLTLPLSSWAVVSDAVVDYPEGGTSIGSVLGDGNPHTLSDLNTTNTPKFYSIESY